MFRKWVYLFALEVNINPNKMETNPYFLYFLPVRKNKTGRTGLCLVCRFFAESWRIQRLMSFHSALTSGSPFRMLATTK
jgi:hypothetical protein